MEELYHFNKNHDPATGQFTSGAGGGDSTFRTRRIQRKLNKADRIITGKKVASDLNMQRADAAHKFTSTVSKGKGYVSKYETRHRKASELQKQEIQDQKAKVDKLLKQAESAGMAVTSKDGYRLVMVGNAAKRLPHVEDGTHYKVRTDDKYKNAKKTANVIIG